MLSALRPAASRVSARAFSTSRASADYAKMSLIGRIGATPEVKTNKNGKEFLVYTVATSDPYIPAKEGAPEPEQTTSWHRVFAYGNSIERLSAIEKGTLVHVEASFKVLNEKNESGEYSTTIFASHERLHIIKRPNKAVEATEE
ncbi:hypothetical protein RQP46_000353 [Phenoliferia psychrophenolica]